MYLVTGATGSLGRRVVKLLRERGLPVRAFVRLTSHYKDLEEQGAEIFVGDLKREKDIQKACSQVRYIISAHGSGDDPQAITYRANIELIDQAQEKGIEHFVYISVLGVDRGYEESPTFKAKWEVEKYLKNKRVPYTILRPGGFANNLLPLAKRFRDTGIYLLIGEARNRTSTVSTDDLAKIAIDSTQVEAAKNQTFAVGGPEVLKREDIAHIFGRVFNHEPIIINPPLALFDTVRDGIGFFNPELKKSLATLRTLLAHEFFCTPEEVAQIESVYNMKMESLESFIKRYLA